MANLVTEIVEAAVEDLHREQSTVGIQQFYMQCRCQFIPVPCGAGELGETLRKSLAILLGNVVEEGTAGATLAELGLQQQTRKTPRGDGYLEVGSKANNGIANRRQKPVDRILGLCRHLGLESCPSRSHHPRLKEPRHRHDTKNCEELVIGIVIYRPFTSRVAAIWKVIRNTTCWGALCMNPIH